MTAADFAAWLASAAPGDSIVYHLGQLDRDRGPLDAPNPEIEATASAAMAAWEAGEAHLFQRRCEDGREYLAVRRAVP